MFYTILVGCDLELHNSSIVNIHVSINKKFLVMYLLRIS